MQKGLSALLMSLYLFQGLLSPATALAAINCDFKGFATSLDCVQKIGADSGINEKDPLAVILNIMRVLLTLVGIIAVIALIISGVRYILSSGDEGEAKKAKNGILYAMIGLVVIGASILIVNLVINSFGGQNQADSNDDIPPSRAPGPPAGASLVPGGI